MARALLYPQWPYGECQFMWVDAITLGLRSYAPGNVPPAGPGRFHGALRTAVSEQHVVGPGETLSHIVARELRESGQAANRAAIYAGVEKVARHNGIQNPDLIFAGDRLDLSEVASKSAASNAAAPESSEPRQVSSSPRAKAWDRLLDTPARLSSDYGKRHDPFTGRKRDHHGIDLAVASGTGIRPLMSGEVVSSGWLRGYGNTVVVRHADGLETMYAHTSRNLVSKGDRITEDTILGEVGSTGRSTGPHLHFEVRRNGRSLDPAPFLDTNPAIVTAGG